MVSNTPIAARLDPETLKPMEAEVTEELPAAGGWQFEPKYDGFRCLAYRRGGTVDLRSRNQRPLARYFPDLAQALAELPASDFVLDGEIVIPGQSFDALQLRLHPAASRVAMLAAADPAKLIAFDLLGEGDRSYFAQPLTARRPALEALVARIGTHPALAVGKATSAAAEARRWLADMAGLDGIIAKRLALPYLAGERAMLKFKLWKSVDAVLAGLYWKAGGEQVETLLFGLFDDAGLLHYVGRVPVHGEEADKAKQIVAPLLGGSGFTGKTPGGKSRWSQKERRPVPLAPVLVAEVSVDQVTGGQFRHSARIMRWRTDKTPEECTFAQLRPLESVAPRA